ncbi:hypothetical protein ASZ78_009260 [Callipepla squamata]|uniref:E3 UFM1-protein ligase 1 n=1 Tax=Callipepla squamata TaxID=9009 RepID=A0A226MV80_CALSU|nr:hypothetical protein ASZ78_009260 [Callipepla squamata]
MAADWEEIRRLAADFQRAQFAEAAHRLSERNCIEIVTKLIAEKQLEVVHTLDGKEYVTPAQISKEIWDELSVCGGRINVVDLQQIINVDLLHIENRANDIVKSDKAVQLVLGQLINESYLDQLAEEVNDKLQETGQVTISELCKAYDLPGDFLTQAYTSVLEELVNTGRLKGTVVGGRQDKAVFVPDIYARTQSNWVDSFFKQNGYLEFDALYRLGIPDPAGYIKKRYKSTKLLFLRAACVGQEIVDRVEASVDEVISSGSWIDVATLLPSSLSVEDVGILLQQVMRSLNKNSSSLVFSDTIVVSEKFLSSCTDLFSDTMKQKAEKEMKNNPVHLITEEDLKQSYVLENAYANKKDKKDERRKKATEGSGSVRGGGGGNAREIKIKKTKKKGRKDADSDEESQATSTDETQSNLAKHLLKTVCTDITNLIFNFLASDSMMTTENYSAVTSEVRTKILSKLPEGTKGPLTKLHTSLNGKSLEDFLSYLDTAADICDIMVKKGDKKKERQVLFQHRQALIEQLKVTEDPALVLHLTSDQHSLLIKYQGLVVKQLISQSKKAEQEDDNKTEEEGGEDTIRKELQEITASIKDLVLRPRKSSVTEE